jgi:hypothetical protein
MMRYGCILLLYSLPIFSCQPTEPEDDLVFDALALVNTSPEETADILGTPDTTLFWS